MEEQRIRSGVLARFFVLLAVLLCVAHVTVLLQPDGDLRQLALSALIVVEPALAAASLFYAGRRLAVAGAPRRIAYAWLSLSAGLNFCALSNVLWVADYRWLHQAAPPVQLSVFYPFFYLLFLCGLLVVPSAHLRGRDWFKILVDVAIVSMAAVLAYWAVILGPVSAAARQLDGPTLALTIIFPAFDAAMLSAALVLLLRYTPADSRPAMVLLVLGTAGIAAGDAVANYGLITGEATYRELSQFPYVIGWILAMLAGAARMHSQEDATAANDIWLSQERGLRYEQWSIYLAYVWLLGACMLLVRTQQGVQEEMRAQAFPYAAMGLVAIVILVLFRQVLMWNENMRLTARLQRELSQRVRQSNVNAAMAQLSGALLSTTSFESVCSLVMEQAKRLTGSSSGFVCYIDQQTGRLISPGYKRGADGADPKAPWIDVCDWVLQSNQPLLLNDAGQMVLTTDVGGSVASVNRLLAAPAMIGDLLVGHLAVANPSEDYSHDDLVTLRRLAALYALAIQQQHSDLALQAANDALEKRVEERTAQLLQANDKLRFLSTHDSLTGLANRACFDQELARLEERGQLPLSLIMVDVDDLKAVNDKQGHAAGDGVLQQAAALLKRTFRAEDLVARIGGDEFAIVLPGAASAAVESAAQRLRDNAILANLEGVGPPVRLSVGVATWAGHGALLDTLREADARMYDDKLAHAALAGTAAR